MVTEKDKEMMDVMARGGKKKADPQVAKAKADILAQLQEQGIDPQVMIELAKSAEMALKDKTLYPLFLDRAVQLGIADEDDLKDKAIDYQVLGSIITAGKLLGEY
jgi:hypothetical protein